jgi:hypothetical protein
MGWREVSKDTEWQSCNHNQTESSEYSESERLDSKSMINVFLQGGFYGMGERGNPWWVYLLWRCSECLVLNSQSRHHQDRTRDVFVRSTNVLYISLAPAYHFKWYAEFASSNYTKLNLCLPKFSFETRALHVPAKQSPTLKKIIAVLNVKNILSQRVKETVYHGTVHKS